MDQFIQRLKNHIEHVRRVGEHCITEETTKQALILPFLDILGFNPYDPTHVMAEYAADFPGVKASERVDYALYVASQPIMFIEAKSYREKLNNHAPQLSRYFNCTVGVTIAAITNGREWRFFTDLLHPNIMDEKPFLTIHLTDLDASRQLGELEKLFQFTRENFEANKLRNFAEESQYIHRFKEVIVSSLRDVDTEFVRHVAQRASVDRQLTGKFLNTITPLVKTALDQAIGEIVINSLSGHGLTVTTVTTSTPAQGAPIIRPDFVVDPDNPRIVTTRDEFRVFEVIRSLFPDQPLYAKDTETYYAILLNNKSNRWLLRYYANRKTPVVEFIVPLTNVRRIEIRRAGLTINSSDQVILPAPDHLIRVMSILGDCLRHCQNDANFRRGQEDDPA